MQRTKENGKIIGQGLRIQVTRGMSHHLRGLMHQTEDRDIDLRNIIRSLCDVGIMEEIIAGETFHSTRVVGLIYIQCAGGTDYWICWS